MRIKEQIEAYPVADDDRAKVASFIKELTEMLLERSDGLTIDIVRDDQFPPLTNGKPLMSEIAIKTWDVSA